MITLLAIRPLHAFTFSKRTPKRLLSLRRCRPAGKGGLQTQSFGVPPNKNRTSETKRKMTRTSVQTRCAFCFASILGFATFFFGGGVFACLFGLLRDECASNHRRQMATARRNSLFKSVIQNVAVSCAECCGLAQLQPVKQIRQVGGVYDHSAAWRLSADSCESPRASGESGNWSRQMHSS